MRLEEVMPAYREGKIIISEEREHYQKCCIDGHKRLTSALESELLGEWTTKEEPKPKAKMWPALYRLMYNDYWNLTGALFANESDARIYCNRYDEVIWPAIPGPDGSYEINE